MPEPRVLVPSDMLAFGDMWEWGIAGFGWPGTSYGDAGTTGSNHGDRRANAGFCDGHVESSNTDRMPKKPDEAHVRRWNNDNQPHPETWLP